MTSRKIAGAAVFIAGCGVLVLSMLLSLGYLDDFVYSDTFTRYSLGGRVLRKLALIAGIFVTMFGHRLWYGRNMLTGKAPD